MHRISPSAAALLLLALAACDAVDRVRNRGADTSTTAAAGPLTLGLHTPGALDHGEQGIIRVSLANRGDTAAHGVRIELQVPEWMEPMPPRAGEPEVTLSAADEGYTRFTYRMEDTLPAGETRVIDQRVRVAPAPDHGALTWSRVVRARLLSARGQALAEIESEVGVQRGAVTDSAVTAEAPPPPEAAAPRDRLGPVRLGMTAAALRQAAAGARDTTWSQEGMEERGMTVPVGEGRALAVLDGDSVSRIEVAGAEPRTAEGMGVGSSYAELRATYGRPCAAPGEGFLVVWFPAAPGVSFALDAPAAAGSAALRIPNSARVTRWWVRRGTDRC